MNFMDGSRINKINKKPDIKTNDNIERFSQPGSSNRSNTERFRERFRQSLYQSRHSRNRLEALRSSHRQEIQKNYPEKALQRASIEINQWRANLQPLEGEGDVLFRGCSKTEAEETRANQTAKGIKIPEASTIYPPNEEDVIKQVSQGGQHPEYTQNLSAAFSFARAYPDGCVIAVQIRSNFLSTGDKGPAQGQIALQGTPLKYLSHYELPAEASIDRKNVLPNAS
ncbi:hypothetical protein ccbrp13_30640 [Ktedonobacteria bacterium brp13]|nr:hypothetical protein ccbrp13_30640 [Ktedonobacteria bacterium brp13]